MLLHELLGDAGEISWRDDRDVEVASVVHDSRATEPGALFCCIPGSITDGHDHAADAVERGAVALLVQRDLPIDVPQARVPDVRAILGAVSARMHDHPSRSLRLLGVTGTNGKTTTTYLLDAIARATGERTGVIGTAGTIIDGARVPQSRTTPEATDLQALLARMRDEGVTTVAMEVSSHALDLHRVDGCRFAAVCFTNLGHDHLDWHATADAYFAAKARLFRREFAAAAAINIEDPRGEDLAGRARDEGLVVTLFGAAGDIDAREIEMDAKGTTFVLVDARNERDATLRLPLIGAFNVSNALAAAATALAGGIDWDAVVRGLQSVAPVPGRLERIPTTRGFSVFVDYAHSPDALARVLDAARVVTPRPGRVIVVFGAGGDRDREKRPMMGAEVAARADVSVVTSDNPRSEDPAEIARAILDGMTGAAGSVMVELDRRRAIRLAFAEAAPGDVVVVAGKGHETGQTAGGVTTAFDDRVVAREELETLPCA